MNRSPSDMAAEGAFDRATPPEPSSEVVGEQLHVLFYQPPCGKWYVHSHKVFPDRAKAETAARKFLTPDTPIAIVAVPITALASRQPTPAPADDAEVRDGWKLVPVVPTEAMLDDGIDAWVDAPNPRGRKMSAAYRSMIAASPKAPSVAIGAGEVERLLETGENLTVAFAELGDGSWTDEKREAYTAFCRALEAAATVALPAVGAGVSDRINAAFDEDINDQASRLGVKPVATESPGWWQQRVRKAAVLAALAPASASGVDRAVALVRRIAARESWQSHYGRRWEDEAAEIVAEIDAPPSAIEAQTYASDDQGLFCRHCGRTHVRHFYTQGVGFTCEAPTRAGAEMPVCPCTVCREARASIPADVEREAGR